MSVCCCLPMFSFWQVIHVSPALQFSSFISLCASAMGQGGPMEIGPKHTRSDQQIGLYRNIKSHQVLQIMKSNTFNILSGETFSEKLHTPREKLHPPGTSSYFLRFCLVMVPSERTPAAWITPAFGLADLLEMSMLVRNKGMNWKQRPI